MFDIGVFLDKAQRVLGKVLIIAVVPFVTVLGAAAGLCYGVMQAWGVVSDMWRETNAVSDSSQS